MELLELSEIRSDDEDDDDDASELIGMTEMKALMKQILEAIGVWPNLPPLRCSQRK